MVHLKSQALRGEIGIRALAKPRSIVLNGDNGRSRVRRNGNVDCGHQWRWIGIASYVDLFENAGRIVIDAQSYGFLATGLTFGLEYAVSRPMIFAATRIDNNTAHHRTHEDRLCVQGSEDQQQH